AAIVIAPASASASDHILSGSVASASGEKLGGATVSAKLEGSTITTSVYADESGNYYFPPMAAGKYKVWAQALSFERALGDVDLSANKQQNLTLTAMNDPERRWRQLPGELMVASLPEETADDARMKKIFMNQCTGCHTPSYTLQFRFDEGGWNRIINLMKTVNNRGVPQQGQNNQIISLNQKDLATYLAKVRGPGESPIRIKERPRPTGEAARAVWTLYDVPLNQEVGIGTQYQVNDGTDWALGTPSYIMMIMHDGGMDLDGNLWFTSNAFNKNVTLGRIDAKTGEVKHFRVNRNDGRAANAHGLTRDNEGNFWFDVDTGRRGLGKMDPKTEKITVYQSPNNMSPTGGAVTIDVDGKGMVWASSPDGVLRFDPKEEKFTEFKSKAFKRANGTSNTYGAAGDRDGNGWWAQMGWDTIGKADIATGTTVEIKLPELKSEMDKLSPEQLAAYDKVTDLSNGNPLPWGQGPRRMGTDKNADVLWVGNSWGSSFARIDTKTNAVTMVPFPDKAMQAYHIHVDSKHNVWGNLWTNDQVVKYDPSTATWTTFEMPVRGSESRHISVYERDGTTKVVLPTYRSHQMFVLTLRSEADIAAVKAQAGR
ncbi:MAG: carboxypeptidase regulatory-like domain-containing protein, partial [Xanthobacteraceae bacterium]